MNISRIRSLIVSFAILSAVVLAHLMVPHVSMARTNQALVLDRVVPNKFGDWTLSPNMRLVEPVGPDTLSSQIYSQEFGRGYVDREGHVVMLLVAYGPSQNDRLQLHRPEICYAAQGFRVSRPIQTLVSLGDQKLKLTRLLAQREARLEPISYWMRVGNDVATGVLDRQLVKLKYGLRGIDPDGTIVRVSTVGLAPELAYHIQDKFIRDLLEAIAPENLGFFIGSPTG